MATNCAVKISHCSARPGTDHEGQSMEDIQIHTSPYPTQVKIQKHKNQTYRDISKTDNRAKVKRRRRSRLRNLPNEVANL